MRLFVGGVRRHNGQTLESLVSGDILPSVSRDDARRGRVQIWTSGNRVFRSSAPDMVISAARAASGLTYSPTIRRRLDISKQVRDEFECLVDKLRPLAEKEAEEEILSSGWF